MLGSRRPAKRVTEPSTKPIVPGRYLSRNPKLRMLYYIANGVVHMKRSINDRWLFSPPFFENMGTGDYLYP